MERDGFRHLGPDPHQRVEVRGRVIAGEEGLVRAPISGHAGVYYRVTVEEGRSSRGGSHWTKLFAETDGHSFYLDDGSGQLARVKPDGAAKRPGLCRTSGSGPQFCQFSTRVRPSNV